MAAKPTPPADNHAAKSALFDAFASVAAALASGRRAEIVDVLAQGERPVEAIATEIGQSFANTSHHLRVLAQCRPCALTPRGQQGRLPARERARRRTLGCGSGRRRRARRGGSRPRSASTSESALRSSSSQPPNWRNDSPAVRLWCSMFARRPSTTLGTLPARDPPRSRASTKSHPSFRSDARSSPTAAARTASMPTTPFDSCAPKGLKARRLDVGYPEWQPAGLPVETAA